MSDGRSAGDQQDVGRPVEEPGQRHLQGRVAKALGDVRQGLHLQREEPTQREVGDIGDALFGEVVDKGVVAAVGEVVKVLDADDFSKGLDRKSVV